VVNVNKDEKLFAEECIELQQRVANILNSYIDKSKILNESEMMGVIITVLADTLCNTFTFNKRSKKEVMKFFESRLDHNYNYNEKEVGEA
tara:strand:- start:167 stop:436 length:270 start_codon:yes stop_codon:yes gene_type:complete